MRPALPTAYQQARAEALPYARAIVGAREHPERFNRADIWHAVGLEVGAIASTAVTKGRTVENVVGRAYPDMVRQMAAGIEALARLGRVSARRLAA